MLEASCKKDTISSCPTQTQPPAVGGAGKSYLAVFTLSFHLHDLRTMMPHSKTHSHKQAKYHTCLGFVLWRVVSQQQHCRSHCQLVLCGTVGQAYFLQFFAPWLCTKCPRLQQTQLSMRPTIFSCSFGIEKDYNYLQQINI